MKSITLIPSRFPQWTIIAWWCAVVCSGLCTIANTPVMAHHFKGLPHFNYFENYPQIPQEEFLGQEGSYEFSLVLYDFQGLQRQTVDQPDDARLFLVAFDLLNNAVYDGPARLEVLDGNNPVITRDVESAQEESVYKLRGTLPVSGDYSLRITLIDENLATVIPFRLSSQKINWGSWIAIGLGCLIAVAAVGARRARVLQDRKMKR